MAQNRIRVAYGFSEPLPILPPSPVLAHRAPTAADKGFALGTIWIWTSANLAFILTLVANNAAVWAQINNAALAGLFTSLDISGPSSLQATNIVGALSVLGGSTFVGPFSVTGATTINTTGNAQTTLGNSTGGVVITSGGLFSVSPAVVNIASPASTATLNFNVGKVTCTGFTTAASGGTQVFTITNNKVSASSFVQLSVASLNASGNNALLSVKGLVLSANTMRITIANNGAGPLGAGDSILLAFSVNS